MIHPSTRAGDANLPIDRDHRSLEDEDTSGPPPEVTQSHLDVLPPSKLLEDVLQIGEDETSNAIKRKRTDARKTNKTPRPQPHGKPSYDTCNVWMVRHGERLDEVDRNRWIKMATRRTWHDPPLTSRGKDQAVLAARSLLEHARQRSFDAIYTSPLLRCMQTAEQIAKHLDLPVVAVPGLAECAAAVRQHGLSSSTFRSEEELSAQCAMDFTMSPKLMDFDTQLRALASTKGPDLLVVTHREGLRDTSALTPTPFRHTPYCCVAHFRYHLHTRRWEVAVSPRS
mmetsp:Transcript_49112/g.87647  ORF Transcript_49112/g.87647 Transcript_49112/m.87647 type:complete len:283 (-) Transcript_49112:1477-2325(-)